ncbi:MAG: hypothetical protein RR320_05540, partial [Oscillospiraceae bacterium]
SIAAMSVFSVFGLYMFWQSFLGVRLYATSCADIQVGVVFGAALISWFSQRDHTEGRYAVTVSSLMLLPMIKDVGLAFALVAAVVISVDMFASKNYPFRSDKNKNSLLCLLWPALLFVALLASYWLWSFHFTSVTAISRVEVHYEYSALQMFTGQDAYFNGILRTMFHELSVRQLVMFGPIRDMLVVFTLLPIVASALTLDKRSALKVSAASVLLLAGFFVYYLFQAYAYAAIFAHTDNFYLMSFERYIASYAIGWMAAVVALSRYDGDGRWTKFPENAVGSGIAAALVTAVFAFSPVNADQYLLTSSKVQLPIAPLREEFRESAVSLEPLLRAGDRIYFVCQGSDGEEWFYFNYEFQPAFVEKTIEGGNFIPPGAVRSKYDTYVDRAAFSAFLTEKQIDYVYLYRIDDYFKEEFAPMFADDLSGFLTSRHNLYRVALGGATLVEAAAQ